MLVMNLDFFNFIYFNFNLLLFQRPDRPLLTPCVSTHVIHHWKPFLDTTITADLVKSNVRLVANTKKYATHLYREHTNPLFSK